MNFSLSGNLFKGIGIATIGALVLSPDTLFMRWSEMDAWSMLTWRGFEMGLMLILFSSCFEIYRKNFKKVFSTVGIWIILSQILSSIFFTYGVAETSVSLILFCLATSPIFASIFSIFILHEKTTTSTWITAFFALIGVGISVANVASATINVSVFISSGGNDIHLIKDTPIVQGSALQIIDGGARFVLQSGDALKVISDTASSADVWVSAVDDIST